MEHTHSSGRWVGRQLYTLYGSFQGYIISRLCDTVVNAVVNRRYTCRAVVSALPTNGTSCNVVEHTLSSGRWVGRQLYILYGSFQGYIGRLCDTVVNRRNTCMPCSSQRTTYGTSCNVVDHTHSSGRWVGRQLYILYGSFQGYIGRLCDTVVNRRHTCRAVVSALPRSYHTLVRILEVRTFCS